MKRRTVIGLFAVGALIGVPLGVVYVRFSASIDKFFHAYVLVASVAVSFPSVVIFLRSTLLLLDIAVQNQDSMKELGSVAHDAKELIADTKAIIADVKKQDHRKIVEFINKISDDGTLEKIAESVEKVAERVGEAIRKAEAKAVDKMIDNI